MANNNIQGPALPSNFNGLSSTQIDDMITSTNNAIRATQDLVSAQKEEIELQSKINRLISESNKSISGYLKTRSKINEIEKENLALDNELKASSSKLILLQGQLNDLKELERVTNSQLTNEQKKQIENLTLNITTIENNVKAAEELVKQNEKVASSLKQQQSLLKSITTQTAEATYENVKKYFSFQQIFDYINKADKAIKEVNLTLGNSGSVSEGLRNNMIDSAMYAASLGVSIEDIAKMQTSYANITGKIASFRADEVASIAEIAKGTSLGVDGAAEMVGNFELMGYNVNSLNKFVTNTVHANQKLGINSDKVLKNINTQFANFTKFRFQNGIEAFAKMATLAETTKITMEDTFSAIDKFRTLQGTLEASARLMSLGGKFAQADPFKLSFLARNKPEEFQAELAKMTNGLATFNAKTKSFQLSAIDMDRLREVADATGVSFDSLVKSATESSKINFANKSILIGTKEDKQLIARLAKFGNNGKMVVEVEGSQVALDKITNAQLKSLKGDPKTLKEMAEASMTFEEVVKNFIGELQASLLPLLKTLNSITTTLRTFFNALGTNTKSMLAIAAMFVVGAGTILTAVKSIGGLSGLAGGMFKGIGGGLKGLFSKGGGGATSAASSSIPSTPTSTPGGGGAMATQKGISGNFTYAASLVAIGVAAVGIGYGIKLATDGFTNLATAIAKLDKTQIDGLNESIKTITLGFGIFIGVIIGGMTALAFASNGLVAATPAMYAFAGVIAVLGGSITAIGFGVKLATDGIGGMASSLYKLSTLNFDVLGNSFIPLNNFLNGDSKNLDKLEAFFSSKKELNLGFDLLIDKLDKTLAKGVELKTPSDGVDLTVNITNTLDGEVLGRKLALKVKAITYGMEKGRR